VALVLVVAGVGYWFLTRNQVTTDDAYTDGNAIPIAAKVAGYVVALNFDDNTYVHAGDVLLRIQPDDYLVQRDQAEAAVAVAEAQLAGAKANLQIAEATYPAKLAQAQAQLAQARANAFQMQATYRRQHNVDVRATTQESIDTASAQAQSADAQVAYDQAQVQIAALVSQNIDQAAAQLRQSEAEAERARAQLAQAELNLSYTQVVAPQDGWIARRNVNLGNYLTVGTPLTSIVAPQIWVVANFKENQLNRMRPGQRVDIDVDAYPGLHLVGHVQSLQMGSGSRFSAFPAENATGNYVKIVQRVPVKILIDSGLDPALPLPLGLSVEPTVRLTTSAGEPPTPTRVGEGPLPAAIEAAAKGTDVPARRGTVSEARQGLGDKQ